MDYYVYALLDPRKVLTESLQIAGIPIEYEPFYIGQGKNNRCFSHIQYQNKNDITFRANKIRSILKDDMIPIVVKLVENISRNKSLELEIEFISQIGTINRIGNIKSGPLTNLTSGGSLYSEMSEQTKLKITESLHRYWTQEERQKHSIKMKQVMDNPEIREKCATKRGVLMSDESKQKLSESKTGVPLSESHRSAISKGMIGNIPSEESRKKLSNTIRGTNRPSRYAGWELVNPAGEIIVIECLKTFCAAYNLSVPGFQKSAKSGKTIKQGKSKGWRVLRKILK